MEEILISIMATQISYPFSVNNVGANINITSTIPSSVHVGDFVTIDGNTNSGYGLPSAFITDSDGVDVNTDTITDNDDGTFSFHIVLTISDTIADEAYITLGDSVTNYQITTSLTHVTASASNPKWQAKGYSKSYTFTAESHYALPSSVTATNATVTSWNSTTGVLVLLAV